MWSDEFESQTRGDPEIYTFPSADPTKLPLPDKTRVDRLKMESVCSFGIGGNYPRNRS